MTTPRSEPRPVLRGLLRAGLGLVLFAVTVEVTLRLVLAVQAVRMPTLGAAESPMFPPLITGPAPSFEGRYVHHPLVGWTNRPRVSTHGPAVTVDARGLRGAASPPDARTPGVARVVVLGDSYTFGLDVADDEVWVERVDEALPGVELINLGVPGYGPDQMALLYEEVGHRYDADVVVMAVLRLDLARATWDHFFNPKPRFVLDDGALVLTGTPVPTPEETRRANRWRSRALDVGRMMLQRMEREPGLDASGPLVRAIAERLARRVRADGALPVLVGLPAGTPVDVDPGWVADICPPSMAACVDLYGAFAGASGAVVGDGGHWNGEGHRRVAEAMADRVRAWAER